MRFILNLYNSLHFAHLCRRHFFCFPQKQQGPIERGGFRYETHETDDRSTASGLFPLVFLRAGGSGGVATLRINTARSDDRLWSARFFVGAEIIPEKGEKYRISATLHSEKAIGGFEVLYSNGTADNDEYNRWGKGYFDGNYGLSVAADGTYQVYQEFTAPELSQYNELFLRFQIGNSPADNTVTVRNITVEKWLPEHEEISGGKHTEQFL